jgi:hypothetical protein|tara:strand:- start:509 stop:736 length:228 start_codon:yes stop_codon:yes gene_type:complete
MSIYPKFDASAYLHELDTEPAASAASAAKQSPGNENAAIAAIAAGPIPLETTSKMASVPCPRPYRGGTVGQGAKT